MWRNRSLRGAWHESSISAKAMAAQKILHRVSDTLTGPFVTLRTATFDTVGNALSLLWQGQTVIISSTVAMIFLSAMSNAFPVRNGRG